MNDNELNRKVCEALGWETYKGWSPRTWNVPTDQPWFLRWDGESVSHCPDFLNDPAESWRLMVWTKLCLAWSPENQHWESWPSEGGTVGIHDNQPARSVVLAFLWSKGVEVKDE